MGGKKKSGGSQATAATTGANKSNNKGPAAKKGGGSSHRQHFDPTNEDLERILADITGDKENTKPSNGKQHHPSNGGKKASGNKPKPKPNQKKEQKPQAAEAQVAAPQPTAQQHPIETASADGGSSEEDAKPLAEQANEAKKKRRKRKKNKGNKNNNSNNNEQSGDKGHPVYGAPIELPTIDEEEQEEEPAEENEEDFSDNDNERQKEYKKGGYHPVYVGELYNNRYRVVHKFGWGYFSTVWLVWDYKTSNYYAMKVQKSAEHYRDAAFDEIKLLSQIMAADPDGEYCCTRMVDSFEHKGPHGLHVVMVFGILGENLLKLIERYEHRGIPLPIVKSIARQMLIGLHHIHSVDIIHTDIKPENVLLSQPKHKIHKLMKRYKPPPVHEQASLLEKDVSMMTKSQKRRYYAKMRKIRKNIIDGEKGEGGDGKKASEKDEDSHSDNNDDDQKASGSTRPKFIPQSPELQQHESDSDTDPEWEVNRFHNVCLADFGNSCWTYRQFTDEVQTRQYRSPEVIIGDGYSTPIDLWSTACMLFELLTGEFLFDPKQGEDYTRDEDHLALMMELLGPCPEHMSRGNGKFRHQFFNSQGELRHIKDLRYVPLEHVLRKRYQYTKRKARQIAAFLTPMLAWDPADRATAEEMLTDYAWFFDVQDDDYSPLCYVTGEVGDPDDEEEEEEDDEDDDKRRQSLDAWFASHPCLHPQELAKRGLTLDDVKLAVSGEMPEDASDEKREALMDLLDELQQPGDGADGIETPDLTEPEEEEEGEDAEDPEDG